MTTIDLPVVSARIAERPDIRGIAEDAGCDPEWLAGVLVTATATLIEADVRAQVAAELDVIAQQFRATSDEMTRVVLAREPRDFGTDDLIRYDAFASAWETAARTARGES